MDLTIVDQLLTTIRSVRRRLDLYRPVELEIIEQCLGIALQAPRGSNRQGWHFMVVTDQHKRSKLAELYHKGWSVYYEVQKANPPQYSQGDSRLAQWPRVIHSATFLSEHLHEVPVFIIPCIERGMAETSPFGDMQSLTNFYQATMYGSILPATWSLMLALRSRGLGSSLTTLHLIHEGEAADLLGIPDNVVQTALIPVAYYTGNEFQPAKRGPAREVTHWEGW